MTCWKPGGDCTTPGNCGNTGSDCGCGSAGCSGCGDDTSTRYPCSGVTLSPDGDFTNPVIAVRNGCIVAVASGTAPVYTPDDCCGDSPVGGGPIIVEPGPPGEDGAAASISVAPIVQGTGSTWVVENIGTPSAAVLRFTAPNPSSGASTPGDPLAVTVEEGGWKIERGLVYAGPPGTGTLKTIKIGDTKDQYVFQAGFDTTDNVPTITINLDGLLTPLKERVTELETQMAAVLNTLASHAIKFTNVATRLNALDGKGTDLGGDDGGGPVDPGGGEGTYNEPLEMTPPLTNPNGSILGPDGPVNGPNGPVYETMDQYGMPMLDPNNLPPNGTRRTNRSTYGANGDIRWVIEGTGNYTVYNTQTKQYIYQRGNTSGGGNGYVPDSLRPVG